jgi:FkbM family methyltransferase
MVRLNRSLEIATRISNISKDKRNFLLSMPRECSMQILANLDHSKAQLFQDLLALALNNFKKGGFFVEFGATDGVSLSNSYLLEKNFFWKGILAEPAKGWHKNLHKNRNCTIDHRCVWTSSGKQLEFSETKSRELSSIKHLAFNDRHADKRELAEVYSVETISLNDLLKENKAPYLIDYLSIDTEGSEFDILNSFDFNMHKFNLITCEHNHTANRQKIYNLLSKNGYKRISEEISYFDDWYILAQD